MKRLNQIKTKQEILARLELLEPNSVALWGSMTVSQMLCHLTDAFKMMMGKLTTEQTASWQGKSILKWTALYAPMTWPKNLSTMKELDQLTLGTPPKQFEANKTELLYFINKVTADPKDFKWSSHPAMGSLTEQEWQRWSYLHLDHHLRQFGV